MVKCKCGSDDLELIAKLLITDMTIMPEHQTDKIGYDNVDYYSEGVYVCLHCADIVKEDGIDIEAEDQVTCITKNRKQEECTCLFNEN